jgi:hypothetical protein
LVVLKAVGGVSFLGEDVLKSEHTLDVVENTGLLEEQDSEIAEINSAQYGLLLLSRSICLSYCYLVATHCFYRVLYVILQLPDSPSLPACPRSDSSSRGGSMKLIEHGTSGGECFFGLLRSCFLG